MNSNYITLKKAAAITQKPERTLRYQLSQGKLSGKKDGNVWLIELSSLRELGLIKGFEDSTPPPPQRVRR